MTRHVLTGLLKSKVEKKKPENPAARWAHLQRRLAPPRRIPNAIVREDSPRPYADSEDTDKIFWPSDLASSASCAAAPGKIVL